MSSFPSFESLIDEQLVESIMEEDWKFKNLRGLLSFSKHLANALEDIVQDIWDDSSLGNCPICLAPANHETLTRGRCTCGAEVHLEFRRP